MSLLILDEADRIMTICNACRYCEGFCAVFPAMERRRTFTHADLKYLANLCHNCRGCYYACQYAPPHPFDVNVPRTLGDLRLETYREYAWPGPLKGLFRNNFTWVSLIVIASIAATLFLTWMFQGSAALWTAHQGPGAFYRVIPYWPMVISTSAAALFVLFALVKGLIKAWRSMGCETRDLLSGKAHFQAIRDVLRLRYLDGGGHGCNYPDDRFRFIRRNFHHAVFYGFWSCFAATTIAFFYDHFLHIQAPYPLLSWPVVLGTLGGLAMMAGAGGLMYLKMKMDREPAATKALGMDMIFMVVLFFTNFSGLMVLFFRETPVMGVLLVVHLGFVLGLFLTVPYGKFIHAVHRYVSLLKNALEQSREEGMH
jgi:citrate/tricarballylate utilization protein